MSGGHKYASRYAKYRADDVSDADFVSYVDSRGDLGNAWNMINAYQTEGDMSKFKTVNGLTPAQQADYWIKRGATSKTAFGRAHAAEDADLFYNRYRGATKYTEGSQAWKDYFKDKDDTYFNTWKKTKDIKDKGTVTDKGTGPKEGTGTDWSPLMDFEYTAPNVTKASGYMPTKKSGIWGDTNLRGLLYNPGTKGYDKAFNTSQYMDWDAVPVESGVPSFGSRFGTFDLPEGDYWSSLLDKGGDNSDDNGNGDETEGGAGNQNVSTKYKINFPYKDKDGKWHGFNVEDKSKTGSDTGYETSWKEL